MPSAILSTERFAGKSIQTEIRKAIDCETSATDFRATSRWCVQTAIHVRSTFQTFVERRSSYLVVFLRFLSGDRSVRPARVTRNLPSENRRQGHPLLESSRTVRLVAPPQSSNASIDRTTSLDSGTVVVTFEKNPSLAIRRSSFGYGRNLCLASIRFASTVRRVGEKNRLPVKSICSSIRSTLQATSRQ